MMTQVQRWAFARRYASIQKKLDKLATELTDLKYALVDFCGHDTPWVGNAQIAQEAVFKAESEVKRLADRIKRFESFKAEEEHWDRESRKARIAELEDQAAAGDASAQQRSKS